MKRDFTIAKRDTDGYVSFEILPLYQGNNMRMIAAERFLKLLLSDSYGALLSKINRDKAGADISGCVRDTDRAFKSLASKYMVGVYGVYDGYRIKTLDINTTTSSLILEIEIMFKGGGTATIIL